MAKHLIAACAVVGILTATPAQAAYTIDVEQVGSDVVASGSGSINLDSLIYAFNGNTISSMMPSLALVIVGSGDHSLYYGFSGPTSFGGGGLTYANEYTGGLVAVRGGGGEAIGVPLGYVSGADLGPASATWSNSTFASLGLTPGTYVWNWGQDATADSFTVRIGAAVPEPGTWAMMLLGFGLAGAAIRSAKRRQNMTGAYA